MKRPLLSALSALLIVILAASNARADVVATALQGKATVASTPDTVMSETRLKTRNGTYPDGNKSWVQFDLTAIYAANPGLKGNVVSATLTFAASGTGNSGKTYIVNGLNDSAGLENWSSSTLTWNNAPGNYTANNTGLNTSLTTANLATGTLDGVDGSPSSVSSAALTSLLNADTDGKVTFILTPGGTAYMYNAGSAYPPTLTLTTADVTAALAFPGAEGWGAYSVGGRGGDVYHVTNLNDTGAGSLRNGITTAGGTSTTGRTIVFDVSGTIVLTSNLSVSKSYLTIAGQTAPGDGICLRDHSMTVSGSNVIIRYIRVRLGDESLTEDDGIWINGGHDNILDHVTSGWSEDEALSCSTSAAGLTNITVQWCFITEALNHSVHAKGDHGYGALIRGCYDAHYTYHHNFWAHNGSRNPRPGNYDSTVSGGHPYTEDPCGLLFDFRNNVMYNWSKDRPGYDGDLDSICRYNYVGNWAKRGPSTTGANYLYSTSSTYFKGYYAGNYLNGTYAADDWAWVVWSTDKGGWTTAQKTAYKMTVPFAAGTIATDTALMAYQRVLNHAGASLPKRDPIDVRVVNHVVTTTGAIIDSQNQVGGWPVLSSTAAPIDTDQDGMPDAWETANGLDPANAADRNDYTLSTDYTNLEVYLNSLIPNGTYDTDITPPVPGPLAWLSVPAAGSGTQVTMSVSPATDPSGVEYYFTCTAGGGHNSGWQAGTSYTDSGLTPGTTYTYTAVARDKSAAANVQTATSTALSATTPPYTCTATISGDINGDCQVNMLDMAVMANTWPNPTLASDIAVNGGFATDISGWQLISLTGASGTVTATWNGTEGNPAGSAYVLKADGTSQVKKKRFYQAIPVVTGHRYKFSGDWKGSILGTAASDPCTLNWAEVYVGWANSATPTSDEWGNITVMYKKAYQQSTSYQVNVGTGAAWAWEAITNSRAGSYVPTDATFTAAGSYMVIAVNLAAMPKNSTSLGQTWVYLDKIGVQEVAPCPTGDLNSDCVVDMKDVAAMAANWLTCNRNPAEQCGQ
jgi:hypothetical protein